MSTIRVLIADDHAGFRAGLRRFLETPNEGLVIVAEAEDGESAITLAGLHQPDVALMDLHMPGCGGIEAARQIHAGHPHIAILMLTMFEDDDMVLAALRAGALGYLKKGTPRAEFVRAIHGARYGDALYGAAIARRILDLVSPERAHPADLLPQLSDREREVLALMAQHRANGAIADALGIGEKTVRNHITHILRKLQVESRAQAIHKARAAGLR